MNHTQQRFLNNSETSKCSNSKQYDWEQLTKLNKYMASANVEKFLSENPKDFSCCKFNYEINAILTANNERNSQRDSSTKKTKTKNYENNEGKCK